MTDTEKEIVRIHKAKAAEELDNALFFVSTLENVLRNANENTAHLGIVKRKIREAGFWLDEQVCSL